MNDTQLPGLALAGESFRVGRVLSKSLTMLLRGFPKYYAFGAVAALPHLVNALYGYEFLRMLDMLPRFALTIVNVGFMFLEMILLSVCEATLIYGVLQKIRKGAFNVGVSIHRALSRLIPVIGTAVCTFALIAIDFVTYHDLRSAKEGLDIEHLAAVFD